MQAALTSTSVVRTLGASSLWGLELDFESLVEVGQSLFFGLALTGYIDFQALRDEPIAFAPNGRSERSLHAFILS